MRTQHRLVVLIPLGILAGFSLNYVSPSSTARAEEPRPRVETGDDLADPTIVPVEGRLFNLGRLIPRFDSGSNASNGSSNGSRSQQPRQNNAAPRYESSGGSLAPQPDGRYSAGSRGPVPGRSQPYSTSPQPTYRDAETTPGAAPSSPGGIFPAPRATSPRTTTPVPRATTPPRPTRIEPGFDREVERSTPDNEAPRELEAPRAEPTPRPRATAPDGFQPIPRRGSAPMTNGPAPTVVPRPSEPESSTESTTSQAPIVIEPAPIAPRRTAGRPDRAPAADSAPDLNGPGLNGPNLGGPVPEPIPESEPTIPNPAADTFDPPTAPSDRESIDAQPSDEPAAPGPTLDGPTLQGPTLPAPPSGSTIEPAPEAVLSEPVPEPSATEPPPQPRIRATSPPRSAASEPRVAPAPELRPIPRRSRGDDFQPEMDPVPKRSAAAPSNRTPAVLPPRPQDSFDEPPLRPITIAPQPRVPQERIGQRPDEEFQSDDRHGQPQYGQSPPDDNQYDRRSRSQYGQRSPGNARYGNNSGAQKNQGEKNEGSPFGAFGMDRLGENMRKMNPFRRQ